MANVCNEDGCPRAGIKRGYCNPHYERRRLAGEFEVRHLTQEQRLFEKVTENPQTGCWEFTGALNHGYGTIYFDSRQQAVHRVVYELLVTEVPPGLQLDHLCRNRACCNPQHLDPVPARVNLLRGEGASARNAVKTHCAEGHEYTEANTYMHGTWRQCRQCRAAASRKRDPVRKAERAARMATFETVTCVVCGHDFTYQYDGSHRKLCSDECRKVRHMASVRAYQAKRRG